MKKKKTSLFDVCNIIFMLIIFLITIYPLYFTVIASLSEAKAVANGLVTWKPVEFTTIAYEHVFSYTQIWKGYANTIFYTVLGTVFNIILTIPSGYVLSKQYLPGKKFLMTFFLITMYFGGGMVPTYLLVKNMGLLDTRMILIITGGISIYNVIVTRSYFSSSIPSSLYEAAEIDGASEWNRFFNIAIPLAKPIIAVMVLWYAVGHWNEYFSALLYINDKNLEPLQSVLRKVLILNQNALNEDLLKHATAEEIAVGAKKAYAAYTMKYAMVFISSLPLLVAYPFVQKHFTKGVMLGAVKE